MGKVKNSLKDQKEAEKKKWKDISRKFKATFHKNMSIQDIVNIWNTKVPQDVKTLCPELDKAFQALGAVLITYKSIRDLEVIADKIYKTSKETLDTASAALTQQYQFPASKVAKDLAKVATQQIIQEAKTQGISLLEQTVKNLKVV